MGVAIRRVLSESGMEIEWEELVVGEPRLRICTHANGSRNNVVSRGLRFGRNSEDLRGWETVLDFGGTVLDFIDTC
jgi:hypothetical protein